MAILWCCLNGYKHSFALVRRLLWSLSQITATSWISRSYTSSPAAIIILLLHFFQGTWQLLQASSFCACSKLQPLSADPLKVPGGHQGEVTTQHRPRVPSSLCPQDRRTAGVSPCQFLLLFYFIGLFNTRGSAQTNACAQMTQWKYNSWPISTRTLPAVYDAWIR